MNDQTRTIRRAGVAVAMALGLTVATAAHGEDYVLSYSEAELATQHGVAELHERILASTTSA